MRCMTTCVVAAIALSMLGSSPAAGNLLVNPGFEDPITNDGPPFVGFWEGFQGGNAVSARGTDMPRNGEGHLALDISGDQTFAGAFQDVEGLSPGQLMNFSVWHKTLDDPFTLVSEVRIEWRKTGEPAEISRTDNLLTPPTLDYSQVSVVAPVPAGADTARVVYAIQSFTNDGLADIGTVYVDDVSLVVVPEPASLALIALGGVGLIASSRRRRVRLPAAG